MLIKIMKFKTIILFIFFYINNVSFCMNQVEPNSKPNSNVFFTKKIILKGSYNNLTRNETPLFLIYNNNAIVSKPLLFTINNTENVLYSINPENIENHQQDNNGNWYIKTIIKEYCTPTQNTDYIITFTNNELSQLLSMSQIAKNSYYILDQYTVANIGNSPIFAECMSVLPQNEYIDFLRKKIIQNLLISKDHNDLLLSSSKIIQFKIKNEPNIFSNTIITRGSSNRLTSNHSLLSFAHNIDHMQYIKPHVFVIRSKKGTPYSFKPQNIDEHKKNSDGDWRIKTTIMKYPKTPPPSELKSESAIPIFARLLTALEEDRQSLKQSLYKLDQWTKVKAYTSGSILGKCITTFSPTEYINFLRSVATQNILVSKYEKDLAIKQPYHNNFN